MQKNQRNDKIERNLKERVLENVLSSISLKLEKTSSSIESLQPVVHHHNLSDVSAGHSGVPFDEFLQTDAQISKWGDNSPEDDPNNFMSKANASIPQNSADFA